MELDPWVDSVVSLFEGIDKQEFLYRFGQAPVEAWRRGDVPLQYASYLLEEGLITKCTQWVLTGRKGEQHTHKVEERTHDV